MENKTEREIFKEYHDVLQRAAAAAGLLAGDDITTKLVPKIEELSGRMPAGLGKFATIDYTNYRGERKKYRVEIHSFMFGTTPFHPREQWFVDATDLDRGLQRFFAMTDIHCWIPG